MDVIAKLHLGFTVRGSQPYIFASEFRDADRKTLRTQVTDDFLTRIPQAIRDRWAGLVPGEEITLTADANGVPESEVRAAIQAEFEHYNANRNPGDKAISLEFGANAPPNEIIYIHTNDTRVCMHVYGMLVGEDSKYFSQPATDGNGDPIPNGPVQTVKYHATLAWDGPIAMSAPPASGGGGA